MRVFCSNKERTSLTFFTSIRDKCKLSPNRFICVLVTIAFIIERMFCRFEGAMRFHCNQTARRPVTKRPLSEPSMAVKRIASSGNFYRRERLILSPPKTRLEVHYRQSHENHKKHEYLAITTKKGAPTRHALQIILALPKFTVDQESALSFHL